MIKQALTLLREDKAVHIRTHGGKLTRVFQDRTGCYKVVHQGRLITWFDYSEDCYEWLAKYLKRASDRGIGSTLSLL